MGMHAKRAAIKEAAVEKAEARKLDLAAQMPVEELIQVEAEPAKPAEGKKDGVKPADGKKSDVSLLTARRLPPSLPRARRRPRSLRTRIRQILSPLCPSVSMRLKGSSRTIRRTSLIQKWTSLRRRRKRKRKSLTTI